MEKRVHIDLYALQELMGLGLQVPLKERPSVGYKTHIEVTANLKS